MWILLYIVIAIAHYFFFVVTLLKEDAKAGVQSDTGDVATVSGALAILWLPFDIFLLVTKVKDLAKAFLWGYAHDMSTKEILNILLTK